MADSNVDLAELEMRFAKDPTSDAFIALSAAYLDQGRFMEAMVVCKKGIRSQPDNVEGRLLLARVYAGQGKVPKAVEEVTALLELAPKSAEAHYFLGQLHERSGRFEEAIDAFKETLVLDRHHEAATAALRAKGIDFKPGPTEEELAAERAAQEEAQRRADEEARAAAQAQAQAQAQARQAAQAAMQAQARQALPTPATGTAAQNGSVPPMSAAYAQPYYAAYAPPEAHGSRRFGLGFSFGLAVLLLGTIVGLIFFLRAHKAEQEEIAMYAKEAQVNLRRDTTLGLKNAAEGYGKVLKIDDEHESAAGRQALAYQLLVSYRGMREVDADAEKSLAHAEKVAKTEPHTVAAAMTRLTSSGKPDEALARLEQYKGTLEAGQGPPPRVLIAAAQAHLEVARLAAGQGAGGLEKAKGAIEEAKKLVDQMKDLDEPSALAFAGSFWRRLGDDPRARVSLDAALRYEPDHDPARVERALLVLENKDLANITGALDDITHLLDLGKDNVGARQRGYATLGRAELRRIGERTDEAQRDFDTARKALGKDPVLLYFEARWRSIEEKEAEALELLENAKKLDAIRIAVWSAYINAAIGQKKTDLAVQAVKDSDVLFNESLLLLPDKVDALRKADKLAEAEAYVNERKKRDDTAEVHRELARIAGWKGDNGKLLEEFKIATEKANKAPRLVKAEIFTQYGAALGKKGEHDKAIEALRTAVDTAGSYPPAYYYLGVSLKETGKTGAAREAFERAAKLDSSSGAGRAAKQQLANLKE